jgi:predicted amidohydrolase
MLVCYDKTFPEAARQLALDGAGLIASLSAWPVCRVDPASWTRRDVQVRHFNLLDQTRALENQVVWVSSNQVGRFGRLRFAGQSKVVDPRGRVLARTGARAGTALARVDAPSVVAAARNRLSYLDDRRPLAYVAANA